MPQKENSENQIKSSLLNSSETAQCLKSCAPLTLGSTIFPRELVFFKGYFSVETHSPLSLCLSLILSDQSFPASSIQREWMTQKVL